MVECAADKCAFVGQCEECLLWGLAWQQLLLAGLVFFLIFIAYWLTLIIFSIVRFILRKKKKEMWFDHLHAELFRWSKYLMMVSLARGGYELLLVPYRVDRILRYFIIVPCYIVLLIWTSGVFNSITKILIAEAKKRVDVAETPQKKQEELEKYHTVSSVYEEGFRILRYIAFIIIILIGLSLSSNANVVDILTASSIVGLAIVFAVQPWLKNMIGGIFIFTDTKYKINDEIRVNEVKGRVMDVTLRFTKLKRKDNAEIFLPNGKVLEQTVENYSRRTVRVLEFRIKVSQDSKSGKLRIAMKQLEVELKTMHPDLVANYRHVEATADPLLRSMPGTKSSSSPEDDSESEPRDGSCFVGLCNWMEIMVAVTVSGNSFNDEGFLKLKTELLLRAREVLEKNDISIVNENVTIKHLHLTDNALQRQLEDEDQLDETLLATAVFQT